MQMIECQHCGKPIKRYANRKYCFECRRIMDDILWKAYVEKHRKEINEKQNTKNRINSLKKKMMEYDR